MWLFRVRGPANGLVCISTTIKIHSRAVERQPGGLTGGCGDATEAKGAGKVSGLGPCFLGSRSPMQW